MLNFRQNAIFKKPTTMKYLYPINNQKTTIQKGRTMVYHHATTRAFPHPLHERMSIMGVVHWLPIPGDANLSEANGKETTWEPLKCHLHSMMEGWGDIKDMKSECFTFQRQILWPAASVQRVMRFWLFSVPSCPPPPSKYSLVMKLIFNKNIKNNNNMSL